MKAHLIDTYLLVLRSRLSAKVKVNCQGHVSQKMGVSGVLVFHKHILLYNMYYYFHQFIFAIFSFFELSFINLKVALHIQGRKFSKNTKKSSLSEFSLGSESQESLTPGHKFSRVKMKFTRVKEH